MIRQPVAASSIVRIGAKNVTDDDPVPDPTQGVPATLGLYDRTGCVDFVEYRKTFDG